MVQEAQERSERRVKPEHTVSMQPSRVPNSDFFKMFFMIWMLGVSGFLSAFYGTLLMAFTFF